MLVATTVSSGIVVLVGAVFLASCVEMVEALTIVLAVGHTRGWRSAFEGTGVALVALAALVAAFGPALVHVPLNVLRLIVGGVLLIFGMQWLRKSILRATGFKAKHDEDAIYEETVAALRCHGFAFSKSAATSAHSILQAACSSGGSLAMASLSRMPARSASFCQC